MAIYLDDTLSFPPYGLTDNAGYPIPRAYPRPPIYPPSNNISWFLYDKINNYSPDSFYYNNNANPYPQTVYVEGEPALTTDEAKQIAVAEAATTVAPIVVADVTNPSFWSYVFTIALSILAVIVILAAGAYLVTKLYEFLTKRGTKRQTVVVND